MKVFFDVSVASYSKCAHQVLLLKSMIRTFHGTLNFTRKENKSD